MLVEVKFWAELTPNQPNAYLKRLPSDGPAVLVFLAPEHRIQSLWPQLKGRLLWGVRPFDRDRLGAQVCAGGRRAMALDDSELGRPSG